MALARTRLEEFWDVGPYSKLPKQRGIQNAWN
jgi:hypothetical protein